MSETKGPLVLGSRTIVNTTQYFNMIILKLTNKQIIGTVNTESMVETIDYSVIGRAHMV